MAPSVSVGFEKHLLGRYLAGLRDQAGLSLSQAGEAWGFNKNKVDAWESGDWSRAREVDLLSLLAVYGVDTDDQGQVGIYLDLMRAAKTPAWYKPYVRSLDGAFPALESSASALVSYQQTVLPGQLQAPGYAQALNNLLLQREEARSPEEDFIQFREERQRHLAQTKTRQTYVIEESALYRGRALGERVWAEQATKIDEIVQEGGQHVSVHVLPLGEGFTHPGSFLVWDFQDPVSYSIAYSEAGLAAQYVDDPSTVAYCKDSFQRLLGAALPVKESMNRIMKVKGTF